MSERKRLVATIGDLLTVIEYMHSRYQDDVSQGRAERMEYLYAQGREIAQPVLNRYPPGYGETERRL